MKFKEWQFTAICLGALGLRQDIAKKVAKHIEKLESEARVLRAVNNKLLTNHHTKTTHATRSIPNNMRFKM